MPLTRDRDQDSHKTADCAKQNTGGWWYSGCFNVHPTGLSTNTKRNGVKYVTYYPAKARGGSGLDSWAEAEYLLVPN